MELVETPWLLALCFVTNAKMARYLSMIIPYMVRSVLFFGFLRFLGSVVLKRRCFVQESR